MADRLLFLTELLGLPVFDLKNRTIGRIKDAVVTPRVDPNRVDRYLVGSGGFAWLTIRHDQIGRFGIDGLYLSDEGLIPYHADESMLRMVRDLLDQQIIDAHGRKVVRVTDVTFRVRAENSHEVLDILEVDIGLRAVFRRLVQGVVPRTWSRKLQKPIPPNSILWADCNIVEHDPQRRLHLNISNERLERMHPADLADIVEELSPDDREAIISTMDSEVAAETLSEVDPDIQASILESLEAEKAAEIIEEMAPDQAADVLADLEEETTEGILEEMDVEPKSEVRELLEYDERTAGGMMNTEFLTVAESGTLGDAVAALRANEDLLDHASGVFLTGERGRLTGFVPLARLFLGPPERPLRELAVENMISTTLNAKQDRVTETFDKYNLLSLPVIDEEGVLTGVITADDVITVLRQ
jgi:magnesium transporter